VQVAIRAGDILLATERPHGLSARNVMEGRIVSLEQRGTMAIARVDCGVAFRCARHARGSAGAGAIGGASVFAGLENAFVHLVE